jgi:hypothetical protein
MKRFLAIVGEVLLFVLVVYARSGGNGSGVSS